VTPYVLGKSLSYGILPDPNLNPAINRIRANLDPDPGSLGFVIDPRGFVKGEKKVCAGYLDRKNKMVCPD
jgi:hypothetical protein